jgi:very-short-patch-repair endonuclease
MSFAQCIALLIGLAFFIALLMVLRKVLGGPGPLPYFSREFLLSRGESVFYHALRRALPGQLMICPKVRLSDVINCSAEGWKAGFGGRISQKHVDFVLADPDTTAIALVIELDDRTHQKRDRFERDTFVDRALAAAGVPILRITCAASYDVKALRAQLLERVKNFAPAEVRAE